MGTNGWVKLQEDLRVAAKELEEIALSRGNAFDIWYRGENRSGRDLWSSLLRGYSAPNAEPQWSHIWAEEQELYFEFAARARQLHGVINDDWEMLFAMQHYGVPTRLLDWTETLGVAVYFALHSFSGIPGAPSEHDATLPPRIWLLNPYELNSLSSGQTPSDLWDPKNLGWDRKSKEYFGYSDLLLEGKIHFDFPFAVYPRIRTDRMQAQRGWFTIHGDEFIALNKLPHSERFVRSVDIPADAVEGARDFMEKAGIGLFTLFPDLQNLSAQLSSTYVRRRSRFLAALQPPPRKKSS
jgi:hypothetical protein